MDSGVSSLLPTPYCVLLTAYRPYAICLPTPYCLLPTPYCLLLTAYRPYVICLLTARAATGGPPLRLTQRHELISLTAHQLACSAPAHSSARSITWALTMYLTGIVAVLFAFGALRRQT